MSNSFQDNRWTIDTAGSTTLTTEKVYVKSISFTAVGQTAGTTFVDIQDPGSKSLFKRFSDGENMGFFEIIEAWWPDGFKVPTLGGTTPLLIVSIV